MKNIVFIRDGVDVDVVRGVIVSRRPRSALTEREVVEVVDQSIENDRIVGREVEGGKVSFLCDRSWLVLLWSIAFRRNKGERCIL